MKRSILVIMVLSMCFGCASFSDLNPRQQYGVTRIEFNSLLESYLNAYDAANVETQAKWKASIDPRVDEAVLALDVWGMAQGSDVYQAQKTFLEAKNKLLELLAPIIVEEEK